MFESYFSGVNSEVHENKEEMQYAISMSVNRFIRNGGTIQVLPLGMTSTNKSEFSTGIISNRKKNK